MENLYDCKILTLSSIIDKIKFQFYFINSCQIKSFFHNLNYRSSANIFHAKKQSRSETIFREVLFELNFKSNKMNA